MKKEILLLILISIFLAGCEEGIYPPINNSVPIDEKVVSFETVEKSSYGGVREKKEIIVRSQEEWGMLWDEVKGIEIPFPEIPMVEFSEDMIVTVFMGEKNTGGYSIEVTKIVEKSKIVVYYKEKGPEKGMIVTEALTQPYHIVKIEKTEKDFVFLPQQ